MRIFYFLFIIFVISTLVTSSLIYVGYSIYGSKKIFYLATVFGYFPYVGLILTRILKKREMELVIGHFLFYYNYLVFFSFSLILLQLISFVFRKNLFDFISQKKSIFTLVIFLSVLVLAIYGRINFNSVKGEKIYLSLSENNKKSIKIGFISDAHLNRVFGGKKLDIALSEMSNQGVEIVLIGGDFVDNDSSVIVSRVDKIIEKYSFPKGIYAVLGNHEYYGGIEKNIKYIESVGVKILRDDYLEVNGVNIIGRDDRTNRFRKPLEKILKDINNDYPTIVVDHNPKSIQESIDSKIEFQLSGHTHNGQLIPINYLVRYLNLNGYGYKKIKNTQSFVSSGLGTWMIPYRIGSQSQYVVIDLLY
ncbi:MAG: metallophosphoesterase [Fusobacteriaceae bacterium]